MYNGKDIKCTTKQNLNVNSVNKGFYTGKNGVPDIKGMCVKTYAVTILWLANPLNVLYWKVLKRRIRNLINEITLRAYIWNLSNRIIKRVYSNE